MSDKVTKQRPKLGNGDEDVGGLLQVAADSGNGHNVIPGGRANIRDGSCGRGAVPSAAATSGGTEQKDRGDP